MEKLKIVELDPKDKKLVFDDDEDIYILDIINKLTELNSEHTHINIFDDEGRIIILPFYTREETDEEFQKRVEEKERMLKNYLPMQEQMDRVEYERLKKLFYDEEEEYQRLKLKFEK